MAAYDTILQRNMWREYKKRFDCFALGLQKYSNSIDWNGNKKKRRVGFIEIFQ